MKEFLLCFVALATTLPLTKAQIQSGGKPTIYEDSINSADTIVGTQLDEVVVEGRTQRVIKNGVEYIPGKNMKTTALDAYRLLYNMQIPKLVVSPIDNSVTSPTGQDVAMYIDYVRATPQELSGMRPEDVLRVEVLDYPDDPRFEGSLRVVNFIMRRYDWGGYTKLTLSGRTFNGDLVEGNAYNKFVTGRWTLDAFAQGYGTWNSKYRENTVESLRDFDYDDMHIDRLSRTERNDGYYERSNAEQVSVRAAYNSGNRYIGHTVGFSRTATPYQNNDMTVDFTQGILPSSSATRTGASQSINVSLAGNYRFILPKGNIVFVNWDYFHSGNRLRTLYTLGGQSPIANGNREKVNGAQVNLSYTKQFQHNNTLSIVMDSYNTFYDTGYTGSYSGNEKKISSENMIIAQYTHNWGFGLSLFARVGASYTLGRLNGENLLHQWNPRLGLQFQYQLNDRNMFGIEGWLYNSYPDPTRANGALVRSNELLWNQGNPDLKTVLGRSCEASYTFVPRNNFSLTASVNYEIGINRAFYDYITIAGVDGLVRTYGFNNREKQLKGLLTGSLRLLNNSLGIYLQGGVKRQVNSGSHAMNKTSLIGMAYVNYYVGNFSVTAYYEPPMRTIYSRNGKYIRTGDSYGLNLAYALKSLKFRLDVANVFSTGHYHESYSSEKFESEGWKWVNGRARSLRLTVTYTLPYGKQVNRNNELQDATRRNSAILEQ